MSKSGNKINYTLRPAKGIERKLIKDSLSGIVSSFGNENYKYIGFGSKYFVDFLYFHRHLHIEDMISVEVDEGNRKVYEFNKPFSCINLMFGHSNDILPTIEYDKPVVSWLDYDGIFSHEILADLVHQTSNCLSGSVVLISYNSKPYDVKYLKGKYEKEFPQGLIAKELESNIGKNAMPSNLEERGLQKWESFSKLLRNIVQNHIEKALADRNSGMSDRYHYKQLFYFDYKDGVEMTTVGGVIFKGSDEEKVFSNGSANFGFISEGEDRCLIEIPVLTSKEARELLSHMPINENKISKIKKQGIFKDKDIRSFKSFYKYYPSYSEIDI